MRRQAFLKVARGEKEADMLLKNCRLVNVFTGNIEKTSIAFYDGLVVGAGDYEAREIIDLGGRYVAPGLIDGHIHIESSMLPPAEFARAVLPFGTTAVVTDPHEIANVMGIEGIKFMIESGKKSLIDIYVMLPSCVPATYLETSGAELTADEMKPLLNNTRVMGLGEMMNYPGVISGDPEVLKKLRAAAGRVIDGHAPGVSGKQLNAYAGMGIRSDHECTTLEEAREKLARGMHIMIRLGSTAKNMEQLLPLVNNWTARYCMFVTDDLPPNEILSRGHLNYLLKKAVRKGLDPVTAISLVTINPARYFGLAGHGAVAPGYKADLVVFEDLVEFKVDKVYKNGKLVAQQGKTMEPVQMSMTTFNRLPVNLDKHRLKIKAAGGIAKVIGVVPGQIFTEKRILAVKVDNGEIVPDVSRDILKICVVERHKGTGHVGVGLVQGFGLKEGALAGSVAHDSHNIIVVGCNDEDIYTAITRVADMGGGQVVVHNGQIKAELPLPIAGLMSDLRVEEVAARQQNLNREAANLGCHLDAPFMTLSFMALPVIPELKITDKGIVDVRQFDIVPLFGK
ncbi:adenine deaminase [Thermincola potens]|uniref:Adenine deaminase n=1 Tax=Thermincola potens (strain JR) TaxID=635013 RepID=D5XEV4_THEPJ|nr:adenine deaminase [Thermincola potens]ADG82175.1 adenine deaminase [Thermincola potens JR]